MPESDDIVMQTGDKAVLANIGAAHLDEALAESLQARVDEAIEAAPLLPVVIDLTHVETMPSMAIGALVSMWQKCKADDKRFVLVGLQPKVREVLTICRLVTLFEIRDTVEEAIGA